MTNLLEVIYQHKQPTFSYMAEYVGKSFDKIISKHQHYNAIPHFRNGERVLLLEIRIRNSTVSCIIKDNVCIEAYQFPD